MFSQHDGLTNLSCNEDRRGVIVGTKYDALSGQCRCLVGKAGLGGREGGHPEHDGTRPLWLNTLYLNLWKRREMV